MPFSLTPQSWPLARPRATSLFFLREHHFQFSIALSTIVLVRSSSHRATPSVISSTVSPSTDTTATASWFPKTP